MALENIQDCAKPEESTPANVGERSPTTQGGDAMGTSGWVDDDCCHIM